MRFKHVWRLGLRAGLRVLTGRALPGWLAVLLGALDWISRARLIGSAGDGLKSMWGFLTTSTGNALLLLGGFVWIFISAFLIPEKPRMAITAEPRSQAAPTNALPQEEPHTQTERLVEIAEYDDANMPRLIHYLLEFAQARPQLNAPEPYVDLDFGFVNASVFDLTYHRVIGLVTYQGEPFRNTLEPLGQTLSATATSLPMLIRHGERSGFTLRQWVPYPVAQKIIAEIQRNGVVVPNTQAIAICFVYTNHLGEQKEACVGIPDLPYEISRIE